MTQNSIKYCIIICLSCFVYFHSYAQKTKTYQLSLTSENPTIKDIDFKNTFKTKALRDKELSSILLQLYSRGYLMASIDSVSTDSLKQNAYIHIGERYEWVRLKTSAKDEPILTQIRYRDKNFINTPIHYSELASLFNDILTYTENNGYPFTTVQLDSISINNNQIDAFLSVNKHGLISIDKIENDLPTTGIKSSYLHNYIGVKSGDIYSESKILQIENKLQNLNFITINKAVSVSFIEDKAKINLDIKKKKSSNFSGIVGFLPNNENSGKLLVSGDAHLQLNNPLGNGELLDINWKKPGQNSQDAKINITYPYLFSSPFGFDYYLNIYKQDTSYIRINQRYGIQYIFQGSDYLKAFIDLRSSSVLNPEPTQANHTPAINDVSARLYGLELQIKKLDYIINPRKGYHINISASAGNKKILNPFFAPNETDTTNTTSTQYQSSLNCGAFIPLFSRSSFYIHSNSAIIRNDFLFENELFRIGGMHTLKGFDDEAISASLYSVLTLEYRFLFEKNSYFSLFWNKAYFEKNLIAVYSCNRPWGFGSGVSFETGAGIFSFYYALGRYAENPFDFRAAKIHIGIVNYF